MAFTHNRPSARRHYAIENEVKTDGTYTVDKIAGASSSESTTFEGGTNKSSFDNKVIHDGNHVVRSQYLSSLNTVTNEGDGFTSGRTGEIEVTSIFSHTQDECSRKTFNTFSETREDTGTGNVFGNGKTASSSTTFRSFRSYGSSITESSAEGFSSFTASRKRVSADSDGNTGNYTVNTTQSNTFNLGGTTERVAAGSVVNATTTTSIDSLTYNKIAGNTGETPNGDTVDQDQTITGDDTVTDFTRHLEAVYNNTTPTTIEEVIPEVVTATEKVNVSYPAKSSNLLSTLVSFYEIRTTISSYNGASQTVSKDGFTTDKKTLTNVPVATYNQHTLHGNASFLKGGVRLSNGFVSGASYTDKLTQLYITQPPLDQAISYEIYVSSVGETQKTGNAITNLTQQDDAIGFTSSEGTIIYANFTNYGHPVNFNDTDNRGYVWDSRTFRSYFYGSRTTNIKRAVTNTTDSGFGGSYNVQGYSPDVTTENFTRAGSDGVIDISLLTTYWKEGNSVKGHFQRSNTKQRGHTIYESFLSKVGASSVTQTEEFGVGTRNRSATLITFDKGEQGGIQYESSSNISGAIRGSKNATIAHEYVTTTVLSQSANVTVNTANSNSYESICHPILGRTNFRGGYKLNRYATFLPSEEYGDIYTNIKGFGYNSDLGNAEFIHEADGSSVIKYAKNFSLFSTNYVNKGSMATQNAQTLGMSSSSHTNLKGLIKIQKGGNDANALRTKLVETGNGRGYFGGFVFTNDKGIVANGGGIPYSYKACDANNSSIINIGLPDLGDYSNIKTINLPANAMIFLNQTTVPYSRSNIDLEVVDRFQ